MRFDNLSYKLYGKFTSKEVSHVKKKYECVHCDKFEFV